MDVRQGSEGKPGRGRTLGTGVLVAYLRTGAALAVLRVSLLAWVDHWFSSHTATVYILMWCLYPEGLLFDYTWVGAMHFSRTQYFLLWGSILILGSFAMATPILLVGWLRRRRQ